MTFCYLEECADSALQASVCIVGSGAAGISLACELENAGLDVLLLEAGTLRADATLRDYYDGSAQPPHPHPTEFRRTVFGGTTGIWGGRCIPFDPIDLESRPYVTDSGWPIQYDELVRHYPEALRYCDAGAYDFTANGSLSGAAPTIEGFDGRDAQGRAEVLTNCIERYSLPTDFGRRYGKRLKNSSLVRVVLAGRCVRLCRDHDGAKIDAVEAVDRAGRRRRISAKVVVLATGGIEVPRLLMLSDPDGAGLGNGGDCLGRHYMCHFENTFGRLVPGGASVVFDFERTTDSVYSRRQLRFSADAQRRHELLNMAFRLHFPSYSDARHGSAVMSGIYLAKSALLPEYRSILAANAQDPASPTGAHIKNVLLGMPQAVQFFFTWLFRIRLAQRKLPYTLVANADGTYPLEFNSEQSPERENRVQLSDELDRHGLRRVDIHWRVSDSDIDAACRGFELLRDTINRSAASRLEFDQDKLRERIARSLPLGGHHMGTARMATSEKTGVVDTDCRVFGTSNLFVASAAVFPTSSHANPTLTIVALATRLAVHLSAQLKQQPVVQG